MPPIVKNISALGNVFESARGPSYQVDYLNVKKDLDGWKMYEIPANPPANPVKQQIWYRKARNDRHVTVTYKMPTPLAFISGKYRIEVFIPDEHASVTRAGFSVTDRLDAANKPVETPVTVNMAKVSNVWVPLGEYELELEKGPLIGQVRQFDDTDEALKTAAGKDHEIAFGPVRWVPVYQTADPLYLRLDDPKYVHVRYLDPGLEATLKAQWTTSTANDLGDTRREWPVQVRRRSKTRQIQVDYTLPETAAAGRYRIEVYIPQVFKDLSTQALYRVKTGVLVGDGKKTYTEVTVKVDQSKHISQWVSLGEFDLDPDPHPDPANGSLVGQVSQFDDSADVPNVFITFGPVRWVPRFRAEIRPSQQFDMPIGEPDQRAAEIVRDQFPRFGGSPRWLANWYDATPYLTPYDFGIHTGADLNLAGFEDFLSPVHAAGDGKVIYAGPAGGAWNFIIVIEHPLAWLTLEDGRKIQSKVYTRYGHVSNLPPDHLILVKEGDEVRKGQHIGFIGFMKGFDTAAHLHFDVSHTERLRETPSHWPVWTDLKDARATGNGAAIKNAELKIQSVVRQDYLDPLQFLIENHTPVDEK
jgi:murein DD-endopeptidase MepM/ murein hydrolase activator NlpD